MLDVAAPQSVDESFPNLVKLLGDAVSWAMMQAREAAGIGIQKQTVQLAERNTEIASWQLVASIAGALLLLATLLASIRTARASVRMAKISERSLMMVERPHLFVEGISPSFPLSWDLLDALEDEGEGNSAFWEVSVELKNHGRTPAIVKEWCAGIFFGTEFPDEPEWYPADQRNEPFVIGPNRSRFPTVLLRKAITREMLAELMSSQTFIKGRKPTIICVFGKARYEGVNGAVDEIGFCYEYRPHANCFVPADFPNYVFRRLGDLGSSKTPWWSLDRM